MSIKRQSVRRQLVAWLKRNKRNQAWLAREIGVYPPRITEFLKKRRPLHPLAARNIERATGGEVLASDLVLAGPFRKRHRSPSPKAARSKCRGSCCPSPE